MFASSSLRLLVAMVSTGVITANAATAVAKRKCKTKEGAMAGEYLKAFVTTLARSGKLIAGRFYKMSSCKARRGSRVDVVQRTACKWWGDYRYKIRFLKDGKECTGWVPSRYLRLTGKAITVTAPPPRKPPKAGMPGNCGKKGREGTFPYCEILPFKAKIRNVGRAADARDPRRRTDYRGLKKLFQIPKGAAVEVFRRTTKKAWGYFRVGGVGKRRNSHEYAYKVRYRDKGGVKEGWLHGYFLEGPSSEYPRPPLLSAQPEAPAKAVATSGPAPLPPSPAPKKACKRPTKEGAIEHCPIERHRVRVAPCAVVASSPSFTNLFGLGVGSVVEVDRESSVPYRGETYLGVRVSHAGKVYRGWLPRSATAKVDGVPPFALAGGPTLRLAAAELRDAFGWFKGSVQVSDAAFQPSATIEAGVPVEVLGRSNRKWKCLSHYYLVEFFDARRQKHRRAWVPSLQLLRFSQEADSHDCLKEAHGASPAKMQACLGKGKECFLSALWAHYARCLVERRGWGRVAEAVAAQVSRAAASCMKRKSPAQCSDELQSAFSAAFRKMRGRQ